VEARGVLSRRPQLKRVLGTLNGKKGRERDRGGQEQVVAPAISAAVPSARTADAEVVVETRRVTPPAFEGQASRHAFASRGR
jgi:hypothetical protein